MEDRTYKLRYRSVDGYSQTRTFKTVKGAIAFIEKWVGKSREVSSTFNYVVSYDGVGKVEGVNVSLKDLLSNA